jgi:hypothetical protein
MDINEVLNDIRRWIKHQRLYASFFEAPSKKLKEIEVAEEWLKSLSKNHCYRVNTLDNVDDQWPDCKLLNNDGQTIGIEVTELVDRECIVRNQNGENVFRHWEDTEVVQEVDKILKSKDIKCPRGSYTKIVLLIHTAELELFHSRLKSLLENHEFENPKNIEEAYLVLSYDPSFGNCPVIQLRFKR